MTMPRAEDDDIEALYEDAPCGHVCTGADGTIVRVNRTLLALTGRRAEELRGRPFTSLLAGPAALLFETYCAPLLRLRGSIGEVALDLDGRGGPVPVLLSARADEASGGLQIVVLSAPTRREYERELKAARALAEAATAEVRRHRELAERKLAEQHALLEVVARLAAGDRDTPISTPADSSLATLAAGLERMRQDIQRQFHALIDRNAEVVQLNAELRHQIEQRSLLMIESMEAVRSSAAASGTEFRLPEAQPVLRVGSLLAGRYRVLGTLGHGAMGVVYEVERQGDERRLAAKVLGMRPDAHALVRFAREARLLARMGHPNLVAIVDVDVTAERIACIVMELAQGRSLADCRDQFADLGFALPVLRQVADGLTAVHAAKVIHRDIKPSNVLICEGPEPGRVRVKLVDFGVSRLLDASPPSEAPPGDGAPDDREMLAEIRRFTDAVTVSPSPAPGSPDASPGASGPRAASNELTQVGAILGTPRYMAPEMLLGASLALPPSDIFSFGVLAYEVLTGTPPFAEPAPLLVVAGPGRLTFVPLATRCPGLAPAIAQVLERCLAEDAALRPSASEVLAALQAP